MKKFKVKIISADGGRWYKNGEEHEATDIGDGFYIVSAGGTIKKCHCELAWQPEPGEMIEVSDMAEVWSEREFVAMDKDVYICRNLSYKGEYCAWAHARPIKKTHTITLEDGNYEVEECVKDTIVRICEANLTKP